MKTTINTEQKIKIECKQRSEARRWSVCVCVKARERVDGAKLVQKARKRGKEKERGRDWLVGDWPTDLDSKTLIWLNLLHHHPRKL